MKHLADPFVHGGKHHNAHDLLSEVLHESGKKMDIETLRILSALARVCAPSETVQLILRDTMRLA